MKINSGEIASRRVAAACVLVGAGWLLTLRSMFARVTEEGVSIRLLWSLLLLAGITKVYAVLVRRAIGWHLKDPRRAWSECLVLSLIWLGVLQPWKVHANDITQVAASVAAAISLILALVGLSTERSAQRSSRLV